MKTTIEIEITDISVDKEYYSFNYSIYGKGFIDVEDVYEDDYENGMTPEEWTELLKEGEAVKLALAREIA